MADRRLTRTILLKTSFRTEDMSKSLIRTYRDAVSYTISRKYSSKKTATGKIYLTDMQISDYKGPGPIGVTVQLKIIVR